MPSIDQVTSFILGISTLATAFATFLTVREMARQRKSTYRPDIVAARQYAYANALADSKGLRFAWSRERAVASDVNEKFPLGERYAITLFNVGFGAAKQIEASWKFDVDAWIKSLNSLAQRTFTSLVIAHDPNAKTVRISGADYRDTTQMVGNQLGKLGKEWGHALPVSLDRSGIEIDIPPCFLALAALQLSMGSQLDPGSGMNPEWTTLPEMRLSLRYCDVGAEMHEKDFRLSFDLLAIGCGTGEASFRGGHAADFFHASVKLEEA